LLLEVAIRCYLIPLLQMIFPQNHAGNDAIEKGLGKEGYPSPFMEKPGEGYMEMKWLPPEFKLIIPICLERP